MIATGHDVDVTTSGVLTEDLDDVGILIVNIAGAYTTAYSTAEADAIEEFVDNGGGLLIFTDTPLVSWGSYFDPVTTAMGVSWGVNHVYDNITTFSTHAVTSGLSTVSADVEGSVTGSSDYSVVGYSGSDPMILVSDYGDGRVVVVGDTAGAQMWAPSNIGWTVPKLPEVQLLSPGGVLPWWSAQVEQAHAQQSVLHTFGGDQADLITYAEFNWLAFHEQSWLVQEIWSSDESLVGKGILSFLAYPVILFELMLREALFIPGSPFNLTYREDEPDDLFRRMQSEGLLPSGWRNDGKMHMVFQGIWDASTSAPVGVVHDPNLGRVHTKVGGHRAPAASHGVSGSGLLFGLPGLLGLWSYRRRRSAAG